METYNNKIDFHSHYLPPAYFEYLSKYENERPDNFDTPGWSLYKHIKNMDDLGVAFSFISISSPNLSNADDETEKAYVRRINEEGADFVAEYPNRLGLIAELPLPNVENSLTEANYALETLKADGFGLKTHYRGKYLGCEEFEPLMKCFNEQKTVLIIHPSAPFNNYAGVNEEVPIPVFEFFVDTTRTFINLVMKDIFNRYPDIKWIFPHAGSFITLISDRFDNFSLLMKAKNPLINPDIFGAMKKIYFDLAGFPLQKQLQLLKQNVPVSHLLYGSDGPYTPGIATIALSGSIEQTDQLTDKEKVMIFTENAISLFPRLSEILNISIKPTSKIKKTPRMKNRKIWKRKFLTTIYLKLQNKRR
ncbi:MAG TPA: amidohydrolase family protein [Bacillota bacterium]|nr:amidohydrolase family protein [Bacillota bacterium]